MNDTKHALLGNKEAAKRLTDAVRGAAVQGWNDYIQN